MSIKVLFTIFVSFQMLLEKVLDDVKPQLLDTSTVPELNMEDNATNPGTFMIKTLYIVIV